MSTSSIITRMRRPSAPGEILAELYLEPRGLSVTELAAAAGLSRKHVSNIITAAPALPPRLRYGWAGCSGPVPGCGWVCSMMAIFTMQNRRCQLTRFNRSLQAERSYWHLR